MGQTTCKQFIVKYDTNNFFSVLSYSYSVQIIVSNNKYNQPKQSIVLFIVFKQFIVILTLSWFHTKLVLS
jgi:hypothetical protein